MTNKIPDHVFRGYDLRGIVGPELNEKNVKDLAKAYATWLLQRRIYDCVVGFDCRVSSPSLRNALVKGLIESGISVYDIGLTLSQIAYWAQYYFRTRGMVMITASHNPREYNGFKFATGYSETMLTEEIITLRKMYKSRKYQQRKPRGKIIKKNIFDEYVKDLFSKVDKIKKFKIVIDACASTPGKFLPVIFRQAGCTVIEQNCTPDGNFPVGTPDPTEKEVQERLANRVIKEKADIGFSYDCDGDRVGIVDEKGSLIWNDTFVAIMTKDILDYLPKSSIVYNTLCSKQVDDVIRKSKGIPVMWKTGHSYIKAKVKNTRSPFGGELSGHFFFMDNFYGHDDGAIASLRLLAYLTRVKKSLSRVVGELPQYVSSPEIKVGCADKIKFEVVSKKIGGKIKKLYPKAKYIEIDGVRMDTKDEMLIVRASQNGPYLTVKFEGKSNKSYKLVKQQISQILHGLPEVDFSSGVNTDSLS